MVMEKVRSLAKVMGGKGGGSEINGMLSGWVAMVAPLGSSQPSRVPYTTSEAEAHGQASRTERLGQACGAAMKVRSRILLSWEDRQGQTW